MTLHLAQTTLEQLRERDRESRHDGGLFGLGLEDAADLVAQTATMPTPPPLVGTFDDAIGRNVVRIDLLGFRVLRHLGLNVEALYAIATVAREVVIIDDERPAYEEANVVARLTDEGCNVVLSHAPFAMWLGRHRRLMMPRFPETLRCRIVGRRLDQIVDHPAFRDMPVYAQGATQTTYQTVVQTTGSRLLRPADIRAMARSGT